MLDRILALFRLQRRGFEAAAGGPRWAGLTPFDGINPALAAGGSIIRRRAAHLARNNPHIAAGVARLAANLVGTGITPQSEHPDRAVRRQIESLWWRWQEGADLAGLSDFSGMQALAVRGMVETGEAFVRLLPGGDGLAVPLQLQVIGPDQVPIDVVQDLADGRRIRCGVELDAAGRRLAYQVYRDRPGEGAFGLDALRIPAADLVHMFEPLVDGQLRGVSWLSSVLLRALELDGYEDATIAKQKVAALLSAFIVDPNGSAGPLVTSKVTDAIAKTGLAPGRLHVLSPGQDVRFSSPPTATDYGPFTKAQLRAIAAGLGLTYEQLTGDLEGVNYSSIRAGLIEFRRRAEAVQHQIIIHQLCRPVWRRFVTVAVLSGALPARDFERDPEMYLRATWTPPAWDWVDPLKDTQAEVAAIEAGLKSRRQAAAERGVDVEELDQERQADAERERKLGLERKRVTPRKVDDDAA